MGISAYARWEDAFKRTNHCDQCGIDLADSVEDDLCKEAFDYTNGEVCCDLCSEQIVEANGQFGVGA